MEPFPGFNSSTLYTPVPNPCFGPLLEQIQDMAELKVVLRGLWLLHRQRNRPKRVAVQEFLNDRTLLKGLAGSVEDTQEEIRRGLSLAVKRGVFLCSAAGGQDAGGEFYLLNTDSNRSALERMRSDGVPNLEKGHPSSEEATPPAPDERPNIFVLYEQNIGMLSPILAEELKEAEELYPEGWLENAFHIAVTENKRSWRYIAGILRRWASEGKDKGKYEGKDDGKSGRHPQKDNRQKFLEDFKRQRGRVSR
jgi:DnaD/phage-associated family protein